MSRTLAEMTDEIRELNVEKGWRPAEGGPGTNTWGDYVALLHSEISEALEAYRDHRLADATRPGALLATHIGPHGDSHDEHAPAKPEGVGAELADVLIRFLDMCDVFGLTPFDMNRPLILIMPVGDVAFPGGTFGAHMAWLHRKAAAFQTPARMMDNRSILRDFLRALVILADRYGIDLDAEYERKMTYNRTRPYQHGGRTL